MNKMKIAPRTRTFLLTLGGFAVLAVLLLLGGGPDPGGSGRLDDTEARAEYLSSCGWEIDPASEQAETVHIPERFSPVYAEYNELQRQQGFDLADYAGKDCDLYTYTVTNYPDESQMVLVNLYLYRGRVIAGDVHSTNLDGFMIGLQ